MSNTNITLESAESTAFKDFADYTQHISGIYCYPVITIFGAFSNILCIVIFNQRDMKSSTNCFLTALAVGDLCKLLNDFMYFPTMMMMSYTNILYVLYYPYGYFISQYFATVTAWMTVTVALERFFMVVYPASFRQAYNCSRSTLICFLVYAVLLLINLPCALRYLTVCSSPLHANSSESNVWPACARLHPNASLDLETGDLWQIDIFRHIYTPAQSLLRSLLPLCILILLNTRIIFSLHQTRANKRLTSRNRITLMLIVIIFATICLSVPDAIMSLLGWGYHEAENHLRRGIREIADALLALNSDVNFFFYMIFNRSFRIHLRRLLLCRKQREMLTLAKTSMHGGNPCSRIQDNCQEGKLQLTSDLVSDLQGARHGSSSQPGQPNESGELIKLRQKSIVSNLYIPIDPK